MIDLTEMNIMFTLNGEMLISDSGSEMAFKDIEIGEGKSKVHDVSPRRSFLESHKRLTSCFPPPVSQASSQSVPWACPKWEGLIWARTSAACATLPSAACRRDLNPLPST